MIIPDDTPEPVAVSLWQLATGVVGIVVVVWSGALIATDVLHADPLRGALWGFVVVCLMAAIGRPAVVLAVMHRLLHLSHWLRVIEEPDAARIVYAIVGTLVAAFALFANWHADAT